MLSEQSCSWQVATQEGVPDYALDENNEMIGYFDRQSDGTVWLRGRDTSVEDVTECLKHKGFPPEKLEFIFAR